MKSLLAILLLPFAAAAQYVEPVVSKDYLNRIKDSAGSKILFVDTANSARNALLTLNKVYNGYRIRKIVVRNGNLKIQSASYRVLYLSGSFNSSIELKTVNRLPALQSQYVQGRSINGSLAWQGPETNELFSYGPAINVLEYDGIAYPYDVNGKLVTKGTGNGRNANVYDNSIFRTASLLSQSLMFQARYTAGGKQYMARINLGQSRENTFIKNNTNTGQNFTSLFEASVRNFKLSTTFNHVTERFSNSNRNGFLNRVYQNSLLTPESFDNTQGTTIGNIQRSYSGNADNPFFLLENNGNSFHQSHNSGNLILEQRSAHFKIKLVQSLDKINENSSEIYKPGTAFFPNGMRITRKKNDDSYFLNPVLSYDIKFYDYSFRSNLSASYILGNTRSAIDYNTAAYSYQRSSHDVSVNYSGSYRRDYFETGIKAEDKFYTSNTSLKKDFFLPGGSAYIRLDNLFNADALSLKLVSSFNHFNSELPISTSFSQNILTQYSTEQALQYLPVTEVSGFGDLLPIQHNEWMGRVELSYRNKIILQAEIFNRLISDDVFPVYDNGALNLANIASHRNKGVELELSYTAYAKDFTSANSVSFFKYKNVVTGVKDGYNYLPIAGFSDVNKAIVKGESLGVIVGNSFQKDNSGNIIIGNDGFPLVNSTPSVIGDPTPDFTMKMNHAITWKQFSFNLDWEWKKGGDAWNGTQAVLDYYGRSEATALLRNTTGYIFNGVSQSGHINDIPVSFYDPNSLFEKNRWIRYGYPGVAEEYIRKGDHVRINNIGITYRLKTKKYIQNVAFTLYANNLIIWTPYKGADPNQMLYDQAETNGLDFFNLPSLKSFGFNVSIQF